MNHVGSLKIARIRGVDLKIHFSLIFLLIYVVIVSALQFPLVVQQAGLSQQDLTLGPWLAGFIFALFLFVSVALHEFGHVWVAQNQGVSVKGVTLMMLGGVSEMSAVPEKPYSEFKLAVIGPLVSLGLGFALLGLRRIAINPELTLFAYWLGSANFALGIFNLFPAFPLDGGRALRSFLAVHQGKLRATRTAVKFSEALAWFFGIMGLLTFNFLLMIIAFFIYGAAQSELMMLLTQGVLRGLRVKDAMTRTPSLREGVSIQYAAAEMLRSRRQILPVRMNDGRFGIVSLEAVRGVPRDKWVDASVRDIAETVPRTLDTEESVSQAMGELVATSDHALPVMEAGELVGVLKQTDLSELVQFKTLEQPSAGDETLDKPEDTDKAA